jgi:hypothetical protein
MTEQKTVIASDDTWEVLRPREAVRFLTGVEYEVYQEFRDEPVETFEASGELLGWLDEEDNPLAAEVTATLHGENDDRE